MVTEGRYHVPSELVSVKVAVDFPKGDFREDLVHTSTSGALVPVALALCHGTGQKNPIGFTGSPINNHVHLKAFHGCFHYSSSYEMSKLNEDWETHPVIITIINRLFLFIIL